MRDYKYAQSPHLVAFDDKAARKAAFWRWCFAVAAVLAAYGAVLVGLYGFRHEEERLAGSPPALMLEFSAESTAPVSQIAAETLQVEKTADDSSWEAPQAAEKTAQDALPEQAEPEQADRSDLTVKKAAVKTERQKAVAIAAKPEQKLPARAMPKQHGPQQHKTEARQMIRQKSAAPEIAARTAKNFAAARNSATAGFNGESEKAWADLVYRKIQTVGRQLQRQLPGARGIAYIAFHYNAAGKIEKAHISRSSGNARIDTLAVRIVETSSPLPPPPNAGEKIIPIRVN